MTRESPPPRIVRGCAVAIVGFVGIGSASALWDSPLFAHITSAGSAEVALLATLSILFGVYAAMRCSISTLGLAALGGAFGLLGIACPFCNQALPPLLGSEFALTDIERLRLYIGAAGVLMVFAAIVLEWRAMEKRATLRPGPSAMARRAGDAVSDHLLTFFRWMVRPHAVGMVVPSAAGLTRAMVGAAAAAPSDTVVEFGGGTGAITTALLKTGIAPRNLFLVERDPAFHRHLVTRFPEVRTLLGDVADTEALAEAIGEADVAAIVSGLPLLSMSRDDVRAVLRTVRRLLSSDTVFVQYTYGFGSPVPEDLMREFGLAAERLDRVWLNVPPATVWRFRLAPADAGRESAADDLRLSRT